MCSKTYITCTHRNHKEYENIIFPKVKTPYILITVNVCNKIRIQTSNCKYIKV